MPFISSMPVVSVVSTAGLPIPPLFARRPEYKDAVTKVLDDAEHQIRLRGVTSPEHEAGIRTSLTQLKKQLEIDSTASGYGRAIISFFRYNGIEFEPSENQRGYAWRTTLRDIEMLKLEVKNLRF